MSYEIGDEQKVYCLGCNGYLWSNEITKPHTPDVLIITCPCIRDPRGKCTGQYKRPENGQKE